MTWLDESEPKLDEVLADPVVRAVMERDGVDAEEIRDLVAHLRATRRPARFTPGCRPERGRPSWSTAPAP